MKPKTKVFAIIGTVFLIIIASSFIPRNWLSSQATNNAPETEDTKIDTKISPDTKETIITVKNDNNSLLTEYSHNNIIDSPSSIISAISSKASINSDELEELLIKNGFTIPQTSVDTNDADNNINTNSSYSTENIQNSNEIISPVTVVSIITSQSDESFIKI